MSYAAEPYAQFVDDLLTALTGGEIRKRFRFLESEEPFRLDSPGPILPGSVKVFGQRNTSFHRFLVKQDWTLKNGDQIEWQSAAEAVQPDAGSDFFINFDYRATPGAAPPLTDRNPGSVVRLLAESFGREYAVLSRQLDAVYKAGFLETAKGRDLDQLAALLGMERRTAAFASGSVIFSRSSPAPADISIAAGTKLSTTDAPAVVFETTAKRTLRRGELSVEAPVQALTSDSAGVATAQAIQVIHRPILGVDTVSNPQPTRFGGAAESDESLRWRARRALEGAGQATTGALTAALTSVQGLRDKDIRISEDPIAHPGLVKLNVALPKMDSAKEEQSLIQQAKANVEAARPVGVRLEMNIDAPAVLGENTAGGGTARDEGDQEPNVASELTGGDLFIPVDIVAELAPESLALTADHRQQLIEEGERVIRAFLEEAGIGEILVYNRLVAHLMNLKGVLDVSLELYPHNDQDLPHRRNLVPPNPGVKPVEGVLDVRLAGALVMLDLTVNITLKNAGVLSDKATVQGQIEDQLRQGLKTFGQPELNPAALKALAPDTDDYSYTLNYKAEYLEAGVRIRQQNVRLPLTGLERLFIRKVALAEGVTS